MFRFLTASLLVAVAASSVAASAALPENTGAGADEAAPVMRLLPGGQKALRVARALLRVRVVGFWAAHTLELEIANRGEQEIGEQVTFSLPSRARGLGFAVEDKRGLLLEAVAVPDEQPLAVAGSPPDAPLRPRDVARERPWAFPVPVKVPGGESRRIVFRYAEPMSWDGEGNRALHLPRFEKGEVPELSIDFLLTQRALPLPLETSSGRVEFFLDAGAYTGHVDRAGDTLADDICLRFPPGVPAAGVEEDRGIFYAATSWRIPEPPASELPAPECMGLVWDASASMRTCDREKALAFLRAYFRRAAGQTKKVRLTVLRHEAGPVKEFDVVDGRVEELEQYLCSLVDDGATGDLRAAVKALQPVEACWIYSDGKRTFGEIPPDHPGVPVYALLPKGAGPSAEWARVSAIPVALSAGKPEEQVERLCRQPYRLVSVRVDGHDWPGVATTATGGLVNGGELSLLGVLPEGKHYVEVILTSGQQSLVLEEVFETENAVPGAMLKARYAYLLARQAELQPDMLLRHQTQKSLNELYRAAVPGYHWGLPEEAKGRDAEGAVAPRQNEKREGPATLAAQLRAWHARACLNRAFLARVRSFWKQAAAGLESCGAKSDGGEKGEIATGRVPAWLREDDPQEPTGHKGKKRARGSMPPATSSRRKVYLTPWAQDAPYLRELERSENPVRTYEKLCARYARSPGFFVDCSYFFSQKNNRAMAVQAISNLAEMEPDYLPLQTALAMRLMQLEEYARSRACLLHILEKKEDAVQVYWLLAYLEERLGHDEQAAEYLVRLLRLPEAEEGLLQNALIELNRLRLKAAQTTEVWREGLVDPAWVFPVDADVRIVLLWDSFDSDIDLNVTDPAGESCDSEKEKTASGGWRSRDITLGLGAESFMARRALPGEYEVSARLFGPRDGAMFAPVSLCLLIYKDYARPGEREEVRLFQLDRRNGGAQLDRVDYEASSSREEEPHATPENGGEGTSRRGEPDPTA